MVIKGLQKLTLLDYPGHTACTVFFAGCNFRCGFCHNAPLVTEIGGGSITEEEFFAFLKTRVGVLDGVAITGGEPLLQKGIIPFMRKIKELGFKIKLDHNGTLPEVLKEIIDNGLVDYIAVDIKNSPEKYAVTAGLTEFDITPLKKTIDLLIGGKVDYEFRTTVTAELFEEKDFEEIGKLIKGAERYFLQNFTDSGNLIEKGFFSACEKSVLENYASIARKYVKCVSLRGI
ncbi:MAG: anaerobic ribonucleoside-triphosphate reductase activating protein [Clostridia bacterium]|nr:anaerobic ribonucleoside-triphosphate reductase activating protein [Clostridia bacterium]